MQIDIVRQKLRDLDVSDIEIEKMITEQKAKIRAALIRELLSKIVGTGDGSETGEEQEPEGEII